MGNGWVTLCVTEKSSRFFRSYSRLREFCVCVWPPEGKPSNRMLMKRSSQILNSYVYIRMRLANYLPYWEVTYPWKGKFENGFPFFSWVSGGYLKTCKLNKASEKRNSVANHGTSTNPMCLFHLHGIEAFTHLFNNLLYLSSTLKSAMRVQGCTVKVMR